MSKQRKRKYLQIVVTFLCICMLGGFSGKQVHAETGYALIPKVKEAQTGWFVKYWSGCCLLYTSDAADEEDSVDLGGRRIIKKKKRYRSHRVGRERNKQK